MLSRDWTAGLPPPRWLYVDPNGGVIEGYSQDDLRAIVRQVVREIAGRRETPVRLTRLEGRAAELLIAHGTVEDAVQTGECTARSMYDALDRARKRLQLKSTLQLCAEVARRGWVEA